MFEGRRALAVLNPTSGARQGEELADDLAEAVNGLGAASCDVRITGGPDDALEWASAAASEGYDLLIAGGGDGTVTAVAQGALRSESEIPIAILPLGTGNGLARVLGVPLDPGDALKVCARGRPVPLDVLHVTSHERVSLLFCGAGLDAKINEAADREAKDRMGFLAYVNATVTSARTARRRDVVVAMDGREVHTRAHTVVAFNATRLEVLGLEVGPDSDPHDGSMDVAVMRRPGAWAVMRKALRLLDRGASRTELAPARRLRVDATPPLPVQIDGDPVGETPLEVVVMPGAVTFVAPADYAGDAPELPDHETATGSTPTE